MDLHDENLRNAFRAVGERHFIGRLAVLRGWVDESTLDECIAEQKRAVPHRPLGAILVARRSITAEQLAELLSEQKKFDEPSLAPDARRIGRYAVAGEIGAGGGGTVWKAWDEQLRRWVAIKEARITGPAARERFVREARAAALLEHPGLIPVHELDQANGVDYIVMAFVEGRTLAEIRLEPVPLAALLADVCDAVEYMHGRGVFHRDIRPQNILVNAEGKPMLGDFGLAKVAGDMPLTVEGSFLGTPQYMAPEQTRSVSRDADPRTDVYGLGATLYFGLTGRSPYEGCGDLASLVQRMLCDERPAPRAVEPGVPIDLDRVVRRAMALEPSDRYASAAELGQDLRRFARGEPVLAHSHPPLVRASRWVRRRKREALAALALALALVVGLVLYRREGERSFRYDAACQQGNEFWAKCVAHARAHPVDAEPMKRAAKEAVRRFESAAADYPKRPYPWLMLGRCRLVLGETVGRGS